MRRIPVLPTLIVGLAVAAMIGLGLWQLLIRLPEKERFLARLAANPSRPPVAFPIAPDDGLIFRRAEAMCLEPTAPRLEGAGRAGYRALVLCRTGVEGPGMLVQLGTTRDLHARIDWRGGPVRGYLSHAPDGRSLLSSLWDRRPKPLMLVADTPPPGFARNTPPDVGAVPNNHLAYAGQWFFFAAVAAIIYALALRRRTVPLPSGERDSPRVSEGRERV